MNAAARNLRLPEISAQVLPETSSFIAPGEAPQSRRTRKQTWLALHFSDWSLHAALHAMPREQRASLLLQPLAVLDQDRQRRVLAASSAALARGVRPGHTLNAGLALCAQLQLLPRDMTAEKSLLAELAVWAQRYTSLVSIEAPNELLLEVRGSLRLFGGAAALLKEIEQALQQRQLVASMALSPTARASLCLSRVRRDHSAAVATPLRLKAELAALPITCLYWPVAIEVRLARFGIKQLGELWRLPRADLARRIGVRYLRELDALLGRQVELRQPFKVVPIYRECIVLDFEISSTSLLEQVLGTALQRLQHYLREHDLALGRVFIELQHRECEATRLSIGLATPTAEMRRVAALLHERLNHLLLPAPVLEISVRVKQLLAAQSSSQDFLADITQHRPAQSQTEILGTLLERLQVRLGLNAIKRLQLHADHRPEYAQKKQPATLQVSAISQEPVEEAIRPLRPLWLLPEPMPLGNDIRSSGDLQLMQGPERIEAGWWNETPIKRDYYVARDGNQSCWVFRDLLSAAGWYRQGWFA
jgi:protein ImuB